MNTLVKIQAELKCPKGSFNSFGKYKYRSAEQILEALKPLLSKNKAQLTLSDDIIQVGSKLFLKAVATFKDESIEHSVTGWAELGEHKGMSSEQCTGTASSYARKYALNGLFLIDETESDPDSKDNTKAPTTNKDHAIINSQLALMNDNAELSAYFNSLSPTDQASPEIKALFTKRKAQINGK